MDALISVLSYNLSIMDIDMNLDKIYMNAVRLYLNTINIIGKKDKLPVRLVSIKCFINITIHIIFAV